MTPPQTDTVAVASSMPEIIGTSPALDRVLRTVARASQSDALVMVYGESGTGKELVARAIHSMSHRRGKPFVTVNCGAVPEGLLENELFGHVRGAYSDAVSDRTGLVEEAEGGTLFLDEIGDITPAVQVKMLRFIQEKEFRPVGHSRMVKADIRIIAATNKDLKEETRLGRFREDLYYRLNIIPITIPPLRQRPEDVPLLASYFVRRYASMYSRPVARIDPGAAHALQAHPWPGNVRELENKIQQVVVISTKEVIEADDLDLRPSQDEPDRTPQVVVDEFLRLFLAAHPGSTLRAAKRELVSLFEGTMIRSLLAGSLGNVSHAARVAGKNRRAFFQLMRRYGIEATPYRKPRRSEPVGERR